AVTTSTALAPAFSACSASSIASLVELEPAPAITGTRPLDSSMHHSTTRLCSSWLSVGLSPVVPTGTSPWVPSEICQFTSERKAASSSEPFLKGVTKAVKEPRNFVLAAMELLPNAGCGVRRPLKEAIYIRAGVPLKGLHACSSPEVARQVASFSRDFAVVAAQKPAPRRIAFSILLAISVKLFH